MNHRNYPIHDLIARRQAPLLQLVLIFLFATAVLRLLFFFAVDQATIGALPTIAVDTIAIVAPASAWLLLRRGHFTAATLLAALAMLLTLIIALVADGLQHSGMLPLVFALPIVFTGLLLDWRWLALVMTISCAVIIGIAVLESQRSPWVGFAPSPEFPVSMASIFVFVAILLGVLLSRFRSDFRRELAEHLQVEATLRQSEARFATAFRSSPAALVIVRRRDGVFIDLNASFAGLLGYTRDELIGRRGDALDIFPGPAQSANILTFLRADGAVRDQVVQLRTKAGILRDVLISLDALELDGEPCILGMAVDITARTRATQQLQTIATENAALLAREQQLRQVAEGLHTAGQLLARPLALEVILETLLDVLQQLIPYDSANIMVPDAAGVFRVQHHRGYERWTDSARAAALVFDPARKPLIATIVATQRSLLIADTREEPAWTPMLGPDYIHCWLGVPLIANNVLVGIYSIDRRHPASITDADVRLAETLAATAATAIERARLFAQLQDEHMLLEQRVAERTNALSLANAELARASRLKDEFLASMSHELRTPLNAILGRAEALEEAIYGPVTPKQVAALHSITESGGHLLSLINDILDLSKIESGQLTLEWALLEVDLLGTVALRMVAPTAQAKRISLSSSFDGRVQLLSADERRLKQILVNLLANAVKFTPEGGRVGIEVRGDPEQQAVTFTVWDTGIGIAAEDLPRLFQPFVQLDSRLSRQYEGTGLGLSLVARLAQAHGGSVAVESTPGQGSRFSVTLPWIVAPGADRASAPSAVDSARPAAPAQSLHRGPPEAGCLRILLAEDNEANITTMTDYLQALGYIVSVARTGREALERAREEQPAIILMDIQMPEMDGLEAIRNLQADPALHAVPIIALTALAMPGDRERCLAAGATAYLTKPVSLRNLAELIQQLVAA